MELFIIIFLVVLGLCLLVAEILFIPGITIALTGAIVSFIAAVLLAYYNFGLSYAFGVIGVSVVLSVVTVLLCMRRKMLKKISLHDSITSSVSRKAEEIVPLGAEGITQTRLAPMGMVLVNGNVLESKTYDGYLDAKTLIKVVGFEGSVVIVSRLK